MTAEALTATALTAEPMATQTASQTALTAATASQTCAREMSAGGSGHWAEKSLGWSKFHTLCY